MFSSFFFILGVLPTISATSPSVPSSSLDPLPKQPLRHELGRSNLVNEAGNNMHPRDRILKILAHDWMESLDSPSVPTDSSETAEHSLPIRRSLGDFDELNKLFQGTIIDIPDFYIDAGEFLGSTLNIWASDILCSGLMVDGITINYNKVTNRRFDFRLEIDNLDIQCELDWRYKYWLFNGDGQAQVYSYNNDASVTIAFTSQDFRYHPPNGSTVSKCDTDIQINDMDFQGGILNTILNAVEGALRGLIEDEINDVVCVELSSLGTTFISEMLQFLDTFLEGNLNSDSTALQAAQHSEDYLVIPEDVQVVDLFSPDSKVRSLVQQAILTLDELLGTMVLDPSSPTGTGKDLGINKLLRSFVLDENRSLVLDMSDLSGSFTNGGIIFQGHDMLTETTITLAKADIAGLDTFTMFDPFNNIGTHTLSNHIYWKYLQIDFELIINIKPSTKSDSLIDTGGTTEINERIKVQFGVKDIDVDLYLMIVMEEYKLGNIELGQLMNSTQAFSCLLDALFVTEITGLSMSVADIIPPNVTGLMSPMISDAISDIIYAGFEMYEATLVKALPNLFQTTVRDILNKTVSELTSTPADACVPIPESQLSSEFINFPDLLLASDEAIEVGGTGSSPYGSTISNVMKLIMEEGFAINPLDGTSGANDLLISPLTKSQSGIAGTLLFAGNLFDVDQDLDIDEFRGNIVLRVSEVKIENLNSIGAPLDLLKPISPLILNNTVGVGIGENPLRGSMELLFEFTNDNVQLSNRMEISVDIPEMFINAAALVSLSEKPFMKFPLQYMSNMNCWLSLVPIPWLDSNGFRIFDSVSTLSVEALGITPSSINLNVKCISCSSPGIDDFSDLLSSSDNANEVTKALSKVFDSVTSQAGGSFVQDNIDRMLSEAHVSCPLDSYDERSQNSKISFANTAYPKPPGENFNVLVASGITLVSLILIAVSGHVIMVSVQRRRHKIWVMSLSEYEVRTIQDQERSVNSRQIRLNKSTTSLIMSSSVPLAVRISIPFVILVNIGLFMSGHLAKGASVNVHGLFAGQPFVFEDFFVFSMSESVMDMWKAGAKELAILIIIFSGVWPYVKQLITLFLWCIPPLRVSVSRRENIFLWLDSLGKWSFVDIFVLILSIASFRVSVNSPGFAFFPDKFYALDLMVVPQFGLYANMAAQLVSQVSSHVILYYHRKVIQVSDQRAHDHVGAVGGLITIPRALRNHAFDRVGSKKGKTLKLHPVMSYVLVFLSITIVSLVICGCIFPSFSLDVLGLLGLAIESGQNNEEAYTLHNLFSIVQLLSEQAFSLDNTPDYAGLGILSAILIFTVFIVPLIQVLFIIMRWFMPLTKQGKYHNFIIIEALQAWQYMEVYIFGVIVTTWQLGAISEFMINDYCGDLEDVFASAIYYGVLNESNAQCFRVNSDVKKGMWILLAASVMLVCLKYFVGKASLHQEQDEKEDHDEVPQSEDNCIPEENISSQTEKFNNVEELITFHSLAMPPPLFTDYFRWFLRSNDHITSV